MVRQQVSEARRPRRTGRLAGDALQTARRNTLSRQGRQRTRRGLRHLDRARNGQPQKRTRRTTPRLDTEMGRTRRLLLPQPAGARPRQPQRARLRLRRRRRTHAGEPTHQIHEMGLQLAHHQHLLALRKDRTRQPLRGLRARTLQRPPARTTALPRPLHDDVLGRRRALRLRGTTLLHRILVLRQHRPRGTHLHSMGLLALHASQSHVRTRDKLEQPSFRQVPRRRRLHR